MEELSAAQVRLSLSLVRPHLGLCFRLQVRITFKTTQGPPSFGVLDSGMNDLKLGMWRIFDIRKGFKNLLDWFREI